MVGKKETVLMVYVGNSGRWAEVDSNMDMVGSKVPGPLAWYMRLKGDG